MSPTNAAAGAMASPPCDDGDADARFDAVCDAGGLTRRQLLIWAGDRIADGAPVFVEGTVMHFRGPLDGDRFMRAFAAVLDESDALTTAVGDVDGWPKRLDVDPRTRDMQFVDLTHHAAPAHALAELARARVWSSASGSLVEAVLVRLRPEHHAWVLVQHQLVSDSWSFHLLFQRTLHHYRRFGAGDEAPPALPQFREYVAHEREFRRSGAATEARAYWRRSYDVARADGGGRRLPIDGTRVCRMTFQLSRERSRALRAAAAAVAAGDFGTFVVVAGAVAAHLRRATGSNDVVLNVPFANRPSEHFKRTIGSFMNVCPVRVAVDGAASVRSLRECLTDATWEAARYQGYAARAGTVPQPYDVLVNVHRAAVAADAFDACTLDVEWLTPEHRLGSVAVAVHDFSATGAMSLVVDVNVTMLGEAARAEFMASLVHTLDAQLAEPQRRVDDLDARSWRTLSESDERSGTLWGRFLAQARRTPNAVAVRVGKEQVTYAALRAEAEDTAARLAGAGIAPGAIVAVWGDRTRAWIAGMLGVWCRGAVYLPLEPRWPIARVTQVLRHSGARVVLAGAKPPRALIAACSSDASWTLLPIGRLDAAEHAEAVDRQAQGGSAAGDLAYAVYTSGSTGTPKGALVEHQGLLNHLDAKIELLELGPDDRVAQTASAGFDISLWQVLGTLFVGGQVDVFPDEITRTPAALSVAVAAREISVLELVPAVLELMLAADEHEAAAFVRLRWVITTGEALSPELCRRWLDRHPAIPLVNAYGPTECADDVAHHVVTTPPAPDVACMPIGAPIRGMAIHVLDADLRPVPVGEVGELCVGGVGVGRGYLHDPERTAAAFVTPDPFGSGARLYRTGDRGRRRSDGTFEWLGRLDGQCKIRGVRVEPAEIEATLCDHPSVRQAAVAVRARGAAGPQLVAYVVLRDEDGVVAGIEADHVREWSRLWDETYARTPSRNAPASFNTVGWNSRYTRRPIPDEEMREWVDMTVERILALRPRRVLEIGCGSGLLLSRIAPACERYVATDLSAAAVDYVRREHLASGRLPHVTVWHGAAHALPPLDGMSLDLVLINSVVQYFPSAGYLFDVLHGVSRLLGERGTVFVGDVRALHLARALHTSVELGRAADDTTVAVLRERIERSLASEGELLLDPAFFTAVANRVPLPSRVDIQLKRGRRHNELTRFRYDVVWRIGEYDMAPTRDLEGSDAVDLRTVRAMLAADRDSSFTMRGLLNPRLQRERAAVELIATAPDDATVRDVRQALAETGRVAGVDPEEVWAAFDDGGHDLVVTFSPRAIDRYDIVLRPRLAPDRPSASEGGRVSHADAPSLSETLAVASDPRRRRATAAKLDVLRDFVREQLPEAMVPARFMALDALPLTLNGKIDREALAGMGQAEEALDPHAEPQNEVELAIASVWMQILGLEVVGRDDEFFALGGDSLLVYRMLLAVREALSVEVGAEDFLRDPTIAGLAAAIAPFGGCSDAEFDAMLTAVEALSEEEAAVLVADRADPASRVSEHVDG